MPSSSRTRSSRGSGTFVLSITVALLVTLSGVVSAQDDSSPSPSATASIVAPPSPSATASIVAPPSPSATASIVAPPSLDAAIAALTATPLVAGAVNFESSAKLPACAIKDVATRFGKVKHWKKTLLDTNLRLSRSYKPWDLVSVSRANIKGSGKVRKIMIDDLRDLAKAARKAGKPLAVRSAHRTYDYQKALFNTYVRQNGYAEAIKFSARSGHSEHQMGTTVDFTTAPGVPLSSRFGDSPAGKWLAKNGWRYGFIMSYPKGKKKASCYGYEPWHWRYFGRERARAIHESGQVPRRYLWENFESRS